MITRRTAMAASATLTCGALVGGIDARAKTAIPNAIDALLIDETLVMPRQLAALVQNSGQRLPELAVTLDAANQHELMFIFARYRAIVGISSGAVLFCLERIARDHGFRLTGRSDHRADDLACLQDLATFVNGEKPAGAASLLRAYQPSRADGLIHIWSMQKSGIPAFRRHTPETMA